MKEWFRLKMQAEDPGVAEVHIIDYIGSWSDQAMNEMFNETISVTAKAFIQALAEIPETVKTLKVHVNSPGGDVFAAVNIANALRSWGSTKGRKVETIVDGMAASAASLIVMAGSPVRISDNGLLMIHDAWTVAVGNAKEMRKAADVLDQIRDSSIIPTYQWHSPMSAEEIGALMAAETWMDADEAIANGFADEKVDGLKAAASIDPRSIAKLNVPEKFSDRVKALLKPDEPRPVPVAGPKLATGDQVLAACAEAGLDLEFARAAIAENVTDAALEDRITAEKAIRAKAEARAADIRALCGEANADIAPDLIASGMTFDQAKAHMAKVLAKLDKIEIDSGLAPDKGAGRKPAINISAIYAELNKRVS